MCVIVCMRSRADVCADIFHSTRRCWCTFISSLPRELRITHLGHLPSQIVGESSVLVLLSLS